MFTTDIIFVLNNLQRRLETFRTILYAQSLFSTLWKPVIDTKDTSNFGVHPLSTVDPHKTFLNLPLQGNPGRCSPTIKKEYFQFSCYCDTNSYCGGTPAPFEVMLNECIQQGKEHTLV
ncbi:hypothetical protein Y032_0453g1725 [Ancylostoma ceylanicum]|uniref:Uncharacterized protein n=1 Tax=Ancylostoma ceylanicum TaxID=53326 RepID=A0A016WY12_9BILA|nr:hypothetical protein Y032_0453g1725 [Ancylostoma ceylanicum]